MKTPTINQRRRATTIMESENQFLNWNQLQYWIKSKRSIFLRPAWKSRCLKPVRRVRWMLKNSLPRIRRALSKTNKGSYNWEKDRCNTWKQEFIKRDNRLWRLNRVIPSRQWNKKVIRKKSCWKRNQNQILCSNCHQQQRQILNHKLSQQR
jgi:hypothetical protein